MRSSMWIGLKVVLAEIFEFFFQTRFSPRGSMKVLPGTSANLQTVEHS